MRGFANTSTETICEETGVSRSSLYNTFVSKDELFVRALDRYVSLTLDAQSAMLTDAGLTGSERIGALLTCVIDEEEAARRNGHAAGCMVVASRMTPALGEREERVQQILDRFHDAQLSGVGGAVRAGTVDGSLRTDLSPTDAALAIASAIYGMRVLSQTGTPVATLRHVADLHLGALRA